MTHIVLRNRVHHRARGTIPDCKQPIHVKTWAQEHGLRPGYDPLQAHRDWCDGEYGISPSTFEVRTYRTFNPTLRD